MTREEIKVVVDKGDDTTIFRIFTQGDGEEGGVFYDCCRYNNDDTLIAENTAGTFDYNLADIKELKLISKTEATKLLNYAQVARRRMNTKIAELVAAAHDASLLLR